MNVKTVNNFCKCLSPSRKRKIIRKLWTQCKNFMLQWHFSWTLVKRKFIGNCDDNLSYHLDPHAKKKFKKRLKNVQQQKENFIYTFKWKMIEGKTRWWWEIYGWKISWDYFNERKIVIIKSILIWGSSNFTCAVLDLLSRTSNTPKIDNYINCSLSLSLTLDFFFAVQIKLWLFEENLV